MDGLAGPYAKIDRARRHFDELGGAIDAWLTDGAFGMSLRPDETGDWYVYRLQELKPRPPLGLILGDMANNLRGALDLLVWQLVLVAGNEPTEANAFPVLHQRSKWAKAAARRLEGVDPRWVAIIERHQPYRATDPDQHPLAILSRVNNQNKHRIISATLLSDVEWTPEVEITTEFGGDVRMHSEVLWPEGEDITDGAVLGRIRFEPPVQSVRLKKVPAHIGFGFDVEPPVNGDWPDLVAAVQEVVDSFAEAFESDP